MGCFGECLDLGPPPDSILFLPPPPAPSFIQHTLPDLLLNTTPCSAAQLCESVHPAINRIPSESGDYVEMPRKDVESWSVSGIDDTWLLVLVASSIGVLLLGALLAMFLLKCREMNMFNSNDCSLHNRDHHHHNHHHRPTKSQQHNNEPTRDCSSNLNNTNKLVHPADSVLYHSTTNMDNRMVWAALTPHGTQHFISENYPRDLIDYNDDHYETIDNYQSTTAAQPAAGYRTYYHKGLPSLVANEKSSFVNSGFVDYDYEDPTPLIESYQMNDIMMENNGDPSPYQMMLQGNTDMRCAASLGLSTNNTLRRGVTIRPLVSSPTRIEHPNLPPLNLYPQHNKSTNNTLKRNTLNYRTMDSSGTLPKYGC